MKTTLLLPVCFLYVLNLSAVEPGNSATESRPKSVFSETAKDPFAPISKRRQHDESNSSQPKFSSLSLKGISRSATKSFALMNGGVMKEGDSFTANVGDAKVQITCKEVGDEFGVFQVGENPTPVRVKVGGRFNFDAKGFSVPVYATPR